MAQTTTAGREHPVRQRVLRWEGIRMTADDLTRDRTGRSATSSLDPEGNEARLLHKLNPREHQVLAALVEGLQSKEIAPLIGATPKRVDKIVERVREKLDAP